MKVFPSVGLQAADILLPKKQDDLPKWSVVACDQFTSEPEYWRRVEQLTIGLHSTYHLILPEAYLGKEKGKTHQKAINPLMRRYLDEGYFQAEEGFVYVERQTSTGIRQGLVAALDLEAYDFHENSRSLVRATEGTIVERLPPRIKIRQDAPLEIPHILVLIDDPALTVIEPLAEISATLKKLYDFDLMAGGGHIRGFLVDRDDREKQIIGALQNLASREWQEERYGIGQNPLLYAVGDGNHSLATAKSIWEKIKNEVGQFHPARFALVELVNLHNPAVIFEPIHRLLKNVNFDVRSELAAFYKGQTEIQVAGNFEQMKAQVSTDSGQSQVFGLLSSGKYEAVSLSSAPHTLPVGSLQKFLDGLAVKYPSAEIDYIHGDKAIEELSHPAGHAGFILPAMNKRKVFEAVIKNGPLPRKTFSMGAANEKRYYLECRKIKMDK